MRFTSKLIILILFYLSFLQNSFSDNHNIYETLEIIKNDLKTLERAVYSGSIEINTQYLFSGCYIACSRIKCGHGLSFPLDAGCR